MSRCRRECGGGQPPGAAFFVLCTRFVVVPSGLDGAFGRGVEPAGVARRVRLVGLAASAGAAMAGTAVAVAASATGVAEAITGSGAGAGRGFSQAGVNSVGSNRTCRKMTAGRSIGGPTAAVSSASEAPAPVGATRGAGSVREGRRERSRASLLATRGD